MIKQDSTGEKNQDYICTDDCWIEVNGFSLWIQITKTGVIVSAFTRGREAETEAIDMLVASRGDE